jgi:hypothetical protein
VIQSLVSAYSYDSAELAEAKHGLHGDPPPKKKPLDRIQMNAIAPTDMRLRECIGRLGGELAEPPGNCHSTVLASNSKWC